MDQARRKKIQHGAAFFALIGALLSSYLGPKIIAWYFDPPVNIGVNCRAAVEWSMSRLQTSQLCGLGIGLIVGIAFMIHFTRPKPSAN